MDNENQTKLTIYGQGLKVLPKLPLRLISLTVPNNNLSSLPKLPETLRYLNINNNLFTKLPKLPIGLKTLKCNKNLLTEVPYISENLIHLECNRNEITKFSKISPKALAMQHLDVSENSITSLPPLPLRINFFDCSRNSITEFVDFPVMGYELIVKYNPFYPGYLKRIPSGCQKLDCSNTPVQNVSKLPESLEYINFGNCQISNLDSNLFSKLKGLRILNLYGNPLPSSLKFNFFNRTPPKYFCTNSTKFDNSITRSLVYKRERVNFTTLRKGTVLFRGLTSPNLEFDFLGPFKDGKYYCYPNFNVYFYPYPFVADTIYNFSHMVMYYLTNDVEVVLGVLPSNNTRDDRYNENYVFSCSDREISSEFTGRGYDACFDEMFLEKYPSTSGIMTVSAGDSRSHLDAYLTPKLAQLTDFYHLSQTIEGVVGVAEVMLHPLRNRSSGEVVTSLSENAYDYIRKNENLFNYKPFYTTEHKQFQADQLYKDVRKMLSPSGFDLDGKACHLTIDPKTKFMMYYEESNKKDLIPVSETNKMKYL